MLGDPQLSTDENAAPVVPLEPALRGDVDAILSIEAVPLILDVVCRTTGMGFAAVARVTENRWITCLTRDEIAFGLGPGDELPFHTTICSEVRAAREPVVIDHVAEDTEFCNHHTPSTYGFQSYISMPIVRPDGSFFGTLCAIDPRPRRLRNPETIGMFKLFADLIAAQLDALDRAARSERDLSRERETAALREQFIAVLGHDLRNPLAAVLAGVHRLQTDEADPKRRRMLTLMQRSGLRMNAIIGNLLDFARGRLGGGLSLELDEGPLEPVLRQVVDEIRAVSDRTIELRPEIDRAVPCDHQRIGQLLSNLLGNAVTHGAPDTPVTVSAVTLHDAFELAVTNEGEPIPANRLDSIFLPFWRGSPGSGHQQGLGLGLYIASQIAAAHGGTLAVDSSPARTRFTFAMPLPR
jgi:signal transduction histidine kinase